MGYRVCCLYVDLLASIHIYRRLEICTAARGGNRTIDLFASIRTDRQFPRKAEDINGLQGMLLVLLKHIKANTLSWGRHRNFSRVGPTSAVQQKGLEEGCWADLGLVRC